MKNYINSWRNSISSSNNPLLLQEGLFDIGLPASAAETINRILEGIPEKGKTMIGNVFKNSLFSSFPTIWRRRLLNDAHNYVTQMKDIGIALSGDSGNKFADLSEEDRKQFMQLWHNLEVIITGSDDGIDRAGQDWFLTKIGNIQRASKVMKKSFKKGIYAKINGAPVSVDIIDSIDAHIYEDFQSAIEAMLENIQVWLKSHKDEYKKIPDIIKTSNYYALQALYRWADQWIRDVETDEQKIYTFDDTSYWYDLKINNCPVEAERMGHCGGDSRASTLYSLRYKPKGRQKSSSYVTISFSDSQNIIYQIKGKLNKAPEKKYYKHIAWLIKKLGNPKVIEIGEHSDDMSGFKKMSAWLEENTDAVVLNAASKIQQMETELNNMQQDFTQEYFYAKLNFNLDNAEEHHPVYSMEGIVGVLIPKEEFSAEILEKIENEILPTREQLSEIGFIMDDTSATGALMSNVAGPPHGWNDDIVFYFYAANLVVGGETADRTWNHSSDVEDFARFGGDILSIDREVTVNGNRFQEDLKRGLMYVGLLDGGPFLSLFHGVKSGKVQENSDWVIETEDQDGEPSLIWFQTPHIFVDLRRLELEGVDEEYYTKPPVVEKILNSNTFKEMFMNEISIESLVSDTIFPEMEVWDVHFENYSNPSFVIQAAWAINDQSNERISEVAWLWINSELGKSDFEKMLNRAYYKTLNKMFNTAAASGQEDFNFPGGKRLPVNESISHKDIIKKWKGFKGF